MPDEIPEIAMQAGEIGAVDLLVKCFGGSKGEARRLIEQGAVAVDGDKIDDATARIEARDGYDD